MSNVLGSILPIEDITAWAHRFGAKVLVDACQSVPHMVVDVQSLNADFLVASSHKMCGPTGIGFLYGKSELLFEAGSPAIGEAIGLGAAVDYLSGIGMQKIHDYEIDSIPNIRIYGPAPSRTVRRAALYISIYLDSQHGVAIQPGNHCSQPLHRHLDVNSSVRSLDNGCYFYNTKEDIDTFIEALKDTINFFQARGEAMELKEFQ
ncbi:hypothetical protein MKX03_021504 [Papaver bracteatum]|nr:hypothetical protein MKX03_021504 [Papaver bracteatum]